MSAAKKGTIHGIRIGHYTDRESATGCTVILCESGAECRVDVRGSASGTRETELFRTGNLIHKAHAVVLSGGSAFGLDTACGVMRYLEEQGKGVDCGTVRVPIVPAAVLFDLSTAEVPGKSETISENAAKNLSLVRKRPDAGSGYQACLSATEIHYERRKGEHNIEEGSIGAGTGATVGKALGIEKSTKGGLGIASRRLDGGIAIDTLVVVNSFGDVVDPSTGETLAAPRDKDGRFLNTMELIECGEYEPPFSGANTTLGVVITNILLHGEEMDKLAQMTQDGLARVIQPCHTQWDGDTVFVLSTAEKSAGMDITRLGIAAINAVVEAVIRAVNMAEGLAGIPAAREIAGQTTEIAI